MGDGGWEISYFSNWDSQMCVAAPGPQTIYVTRARAITICNELWQQCCCNMQPSLYSVSKGKARRQTQRQQQTLKAAQSTQESDGERESSAVERVSASFCSRRRCCSLSHSLARFVCNLCTIWREASRKFYVAWGR